MASLLDQHPIVVAIAGPNGAGKTTFYHAHIQPAGLRFVNADVLARELNLEPYAAMKLADSLRRELVNQRESFVFETVFSDPVGDKVSFLQEIAESGYTVLLCFVGVSGPRVSEERVAMRVSQGGHDVPTNKLLTRYSRTLTNLKTAIQKLPHVWVFDNDDLRAPYRLVAIYERGQIVKQHQPVPQWLRRVLPKKGRDPLSSKFDALLARMQLPKARLAMNAAFHATPQQLGKAAVAAARGRG